MGNVQTYKITNKILLRDYLKDVFQSSGLIVQLTARNIIVKYTNSLLGILWALLEPVATLLVFTFVFGVLGRFNVTDSAVPYSLVVISGIVCWQFFATNLSDVGASLLSGEHILKKVYFPHIILSLSASLSVLTEFFILVFCFFIALIAYQVPITARMLWGLPIILNIYFVALGPGLLIASLNIKYRDFKHLVPILLRVGFYLSPVAYPIELVLNQQRFGEWVVYAYFLNPMAGAINMFRWAFFGDTLHMMAVWSSVAFSLLFLFIGIFCFIKNEEKLVDNI